MAPQKSIAIGQQQQQQQQSTMLSKDSGDQVQSARARKRRQQATGGPAQQQQQLANGNGKPSDTSKNNKENLASKHLAVDKASAAQRCQQAQQAASVVPSERTNPISNINNSNSTNNNNNNNSFSNSNNNSSSNSNANKTQRNQVPTPEKRAPLAAGAKSNSPPANTILAKQLSDELPDDIDAGIELDGSSNSGSSVKDMADEQGKSASVSPVMAQSSLVSERRGETAAGRHAVEVAPLEQLAGALCTDVAPVCKRATSVAPVAASTTTKQQLAANQQVIDADEQQLQQKLQNRQQQRRSSLQQQQGNTSLTNPSASGPGGGGGPAPPQSPALCKVCGQHVYQMERMLAEKCVYHRSCFRCHQCKTQLRVDNYSSHEGQVYCKAHHRQLFQPQVRLDDDDDVDIVAKSTPSKHTDDYLTHRGRLSELSFSFLQPKPEGIRKRQMIICENEPAELPKDVVRCDTKVDDGIDQLKLNLNNILEKFERRASADESAPSSAGVVIEKPSFNVRQTLLAFETRTLPGPADGQASAPGAERPVVRKLTNSSGFLNRQASVESEPAPAPNKPLAVRRSESLMQRLKKYELRIAGEQVVDDEDEDDEDDDADASDSDRGDNNQPGNRNDSQGDAKVVRPSRGSRLAPKKLGSVNLSSLKSQWESGDINRSAAAEVAGADSSRGGKFVDGNLVSENGSTNSPLLEKQEELSRLRRQLADRKLAGGDSPAGPASVRNIYENAIREAQLQQSQQASRRNSKDLLALNGFSTSEIQQQLLQQSGSSQQNKATPTTPNKDHFQLNFNNKANRLKERFELGLIDNKSADESDGERDEGAGAARPAAMTKLDQLRQEKLDDLSVFTEGEIKAREARSMFQQIDRRLSAASGGAGAGGGQASPGSRPLSTISASMRTKLLGQMNAANGTKPADDKGPASQGPVGGQPAAQPIRLTNNVGK